MMRDLDLATRLLPNGLLEAFSFELEIESSLLSHTSLCLNQHLNNMLINDTWVIFMTHGINVTHGHNIWWNDVFAVVLQHPSEHSES